MTSNAKSYQNPSILASALKVVGLAAAVFLGGMFLRTMLFGAGGAAQTPAVFASHTTLDAAFDAADGGPVLAFATADWCRPCQSLKRGALADARFAEWINQERVTTAYLDATGANADAQRLGVQSLPTLIYFNDGQEIARTSGVMSASALLDWLERARQL